METSDNLVILYLLVFRLAIIAAGTISIILGYKLFVKGVFADASGGTGVEAGVGALKMSMKNAAPGSVFAFFGVVVISVMLLQEPPGLDREGGKVKLRGEQQGSEARPAGDTPATGGLEADLETAVENLIESVDRYDNGVQSLARLLAQFSNDRAWSFYQASRFDEALPLSDIGVRLAPDNAEHLDTRARILFAGQRYEEAIGLIRRAAELDDKHQATLQQFQRDLPR